jgi:hypothetical protein
LVRHRVLGEIVTFKNSNAFHHDGILYADASYTTTVVHVHGSFGNFYQNEFLRVMAKNYLASRINFLVFNLAGHDALAEGYRNEWDFEYAGGAVTKFEECINDIQAAIDFVSPFSKRVVLQGHSMGCDRVLHFLLTSGAKHDFILISPCDSYRLQTHWIAPETIDHQIERLKSEPVSAEGLDWLPTREYGLGQGEWTYPIHITRSSLLSVLEGPAFQLVRIDQPAAFHIDQNALIYIGGDDELQTSPRDIMFKYFDDRVRHLTPVSLYPEGDHSLWGCEQEVSDEVVNWINSVIHQPNT